MKNNYTQCKLQKGNCYQTAWIPSQFATLNRILKIRENSVWDNGWKVIFVGATKTDEETEVLKNAHRTQRRASDI